MKVIFSDEAFEVTGGKVSRVFPDATAKISHPVATNATNPSGSGLIYADYPSASLPELHKKEIEHQSGANAILVTTMNNGDTRISLGIIDVI
jgi:hypothetical protein